MKTVCAIVLAPFVFLLLVVLVIASLPMMIIGISFLFMGDEERYDWWMDHSPLAYVMDRTYA